jgi:hypothetical protein
MKVAIVVFVAVRTRPDRDARKAALLRAFSMRVDVKEYRLLVWRKRARHTGRVCPLDQRDRSFPKLDVFLRPNAF